MKGKECKRRQMDEKGRKRMESVKKNGREGE